MELVEQQVLDALGALALERVREEVATDSCELFREREHLQSQRQSFHEAAVLGGVSEQATDVLGTASQQLSYFARLQRASSADTQLRLRQCRQRICGRAA